jgi:SAM-dependent methyltransferase
MRGRVVELGVGSGAMAVDLLERYPDITYRGVEIDPKLADDARKRLGVLHSERARVDVGDATHNDVLPASADVVCSFLMLHHTLDAPAVINQTARRLAPGGWFVGYDFTDCLLARVLHRLDGSKHRLYTPSEIAEGFDSASWTQVTVDSGWRNRLVKFKAQRSGEQLPY